MQRGTLTPVLGPQKRRENKAVPTEKDELTDRVNGKFCETLFDDEPISEQNLVLGAPTNRASERTSLPYVVIA
jgi:hypothetical protein